MAGKAALLAASLRSIPSGRLSYIIMCDIPFILQSGNLPPGTKRTFAVYSNRDIDKFPHDEQPG
ncbi:MAG: hypothetical protein II969_12660 [Anaerolineaceae bacterium]|nr:hypothetical protein [Anaerolineaceae bacterium]